MSTHVETKLMRRARLQSEALDLVRSGYSFSQASEQLGISQPTVARWAKEAGISSPANSRWSDLSHRVPAAKRVRALGGTWKDVADTWGAIEGYAVGTANAWIWISKHAPQMVGNRKIKLSPRVRKAIASEYSAGVSA